MFKYISLFFFFSHCFEPITTVLFPTTNSTSHSSRHRIITKSGTEDKRSESQPVSMKMIEKKFQKASSLLVYGYLRSAQENYKLQLRQDIQETILAHYYKEYHPSKDAVLFWYNTLIGYKSFHVSTLLQFIVIHDLVEKKDLDAVFLQAIEYGSTDVVKILLEKEDTLGIENLRNVLALAKNDKLKELIIEDIIKRIDEKLDDYYKLNQEDYFYKDEFFIPKFILYNDKSIRLKIIKNIRQGKAPFTDMTFSYKNASYGFNAIKLYMKMQGIDFFSYVEVTLYNSKKICGQLNDRTCNISKDKDSLTLHKGTIRINLPLKNIREIRLYKDPEASASLKRDFN